MNQHFAHLLSLPRLTVLAAIVLLSGCLTIEEHYSFKKDGSGTMEYVMDASGMQELFDSLGNMNSDDATGKGGKKKKKKPGNDGEGIMGNDLNGQVAQLKQLAGIKKVKRKTEKDGYLERVSFAFADLGALNRALNVLMPDSTNAAQEFFRWEGSTLVRTNNRYAEALGSDMSSWSDSTGVADVLATMKYKMSFSFANDLGEVQTGMEKARPKAKQLDLSTDFAEIMKDPKVMELRIGLDK